jgi:hypothetical protein
LLLTEIKLSPIRRSGSCRQCALPEKKALPEIGLTGPSILLVDGEQIGKNPNAKSCRRFIQDAKLNADAPLQNVP